MRIRHRIILSGLSEKDASNYVQAHRDCRVGYEPIAMAWAVIKFVYGR